MSVGPPRLSDQHPLQPITDWDEAIALVRLVNEELGKELDKAKDQFSESERQPFWLARYAYGDLIVEDGKFKLPHLSVRRVGPVEVPTYSQPPLVLVLEKSVEVFFNTRYDHNKGHLVPLRLIRAGEMFGVFEAADRIVRLPPANVDYSISSGSRSVWIIAPIGNRDLIRSLEEDLDIPRGGAEWRGKDFHYKLVRATTGVSTKWHTLVLIFPECLTTSDATKDFAHNLLMLGWKQSTNSRRQFGPDADLRQLCELGNRSADTERIAQHIVSAIRGEFPVFRPTMGLQEHAGPFEEFRQSLRRVLDGSGKIRLRRVPEPIVLQACPLTGPGDFAYYSFKRHSLRHPPNPNRYHDLCSQLEYLFSLNNRTEEERMLLSRLLSYPANINGTDSVVTAELQFFDHVIKPARFHRPLPISDFGLEDPNQIDVERGFFLCCMRIGLSKADA